MFYLFLFIIGIFVGSFLNVVIDRVPREESILFGRSHCDFCQHQLAWYDLIPLISFISLKGKCRYCKKFIGFKYPIVELSTGSLFALTLLISYHLPAGRQGLSLITLIFDLFITSCLIIIFFTDLFYGIIPDVIVFPAIIINFVYIILFNSQILIPNLLSAFGAFSLFLFLFLITKGKGMGFGDVKFVFLMGLFLGWPQIFIGLYASFLTGAIVALILVFAKRKNLKGGTIAFGPFLVFGTYLAWFLGNFLWQLVIGLKML